MDAASRKEFWSLWRHPRGTSIQNSTVSPRDSNQRWKKRWNSFGWTTKSGTACRASLRLCKNRLYLDPSIMIAVVTVMVLEGWQCLDLSVSILDRLNSVLELSKKGTTEWKSWIGPCGKCMIRTADQTFMKRTKVTRRDGVSLSITAYHLRVAIED